MKKHLIFVLIFIIVVPVWSISVIWGAMIDIENDAIRYRFEQVLKERLEDFALGSGPFKYSNLRIPLYRQA